MLFLRKLIVFCIVSIFCIGTFTPYDAYSISIKKEEELSKEFMKMVQIHFKLIKDPLIAGYVEKLGQHIISSIPPQPFTYHFYVIHEDNYNAFAGPGGLIFIYSGLLAAMENEEELAGILSHEIAHVTNRHHSQNIERSKNISLATIAGITAGILLGAGGVPAEALTLGTLAAGQSVALAYSREDEMEADITGLQYLRNAGYTGEGLLTMLTKIRSKQWFSSDQVPTYLMTHPAIEARMAYLGSNIEINQKIPDQSPQKTKSDFDWAHTKLIAMYWEEKIALKKFEAEIRKHPESPLAHYGYGLALTRTNNRKNAIVHLKIALEKKAFDPNILTDLGRVYFLDGQYQEALNILHNAKDFTQNGPEARILLGRTQIALERFQEAELTFESIVNQYGDHVDVLYYLGEAYGKQGKLGKSHYSLAIYYKKSRKLSSAVFHLERALQHTKDPGENRKIEEMLKELRSKLEGKRH